MHPYWKLMWAEALECGLFRQSRVLLRQDQITFSASGLLCDLVDSSKWDGNTYNGALFDPPASVLTRVRMTQKEMQRINALSERGACFNEIATAVKRIA